MISLLLLSACALTAYVIWRTGIFSPASIVSAFSVMSLLVFWWVVFSGVDSVVHSSGLSWEIKDYSQQAPTVIAIYTLIIAVTALATIRLPGKSEESSESDSVSDYILAFLTRFLVSSAIPIVAFGLFFLTALHLLLSLSSYSDFALTKIISQGSGPICIMICCLAIYSWRSQNPLVRTILGITFAYHYLLLLAFYSRYTSLTWTIAAILLISQRMAARKRPFTAGIVVCLACSVWFFLFALQGRTYRNSDSNFSHINVGQIADTLFSVKADDTTLSTVTMNIFQGPLVLAEALRMTPLTYPSKYEMISFSPFPAFVDGWQKINDLQYRVNRYTPFNAFAELYYFGWAYILAFILIFIVCIRILTRVYLQLGPVVGLLLMSPCVYALLYLHQYPLRNSIRLIYYTTVVVYFLSQSLYKRALVARGRSAQSGYNPSVPLLRAAQR